MAGCQYMERGSFPRNIHSQSSSRHTAGTSRRSSPYTVQRAILKKKTRRLSLSLSLPLEHSPRSKFSRSPVLCPRAEAALTRDKDLSSFFVRTLLFPPPLPLRRHRAHAGTCAYVHTRDYNSTSWWGTSAFVRWYARLLRRQRLRKDAQEADESTTEADNREVPVRESSGGKWKKTVAGKSARV